MMFLHSISDSSFFPSCQVAQVQFRHQIGLQKVGHWDVNSSDCTSIQLTGPSIFWVIRSLVSLLQNPILNLCGLTWRLWCDICQISNMSVITIWHNVLLAICWCSIIHLCSLLWKGNFIYFRPLWGWGVGESQGWRLELPLSRRWK